MELPKSGVRGFFEIFTPGMFLLLNLLVTIGLLAASVIGSAHEGNEMSIAKGLSDLMQVILANVTYSVALVLSLGYIMGVVLRMMRTHWVDKLSGAFIYYVARPRFREAAFVTEPFFFLNWLRKDCRERLPAGVMKFFEDYWADKCRHDAVANTTFFNFCKVILADTQAKALDEVHGAEAYVRFMAGSVYALIAAIVLTGIDFFACWAMSSSRVGVIPLAVMFVYFLLLLVILYEFRFLRCREVFLVFAACFANRNAFDKLFPTQAERDLLPYDDYETRRRLLNAAWQQGHTPDTARRALDLKQLLLAMRKESRTDPYLSSLYFAGADVDHPYFLKNEVLAVGLAVLPEDAEKSAKHKRHPHQVEVLFVVEGAIRVHVEQNGAVSETAVSAGEHFVIEKGQCHWITLEGQQAAFVFVKTNCAEKPRSEDCGPEAGSATMT